MKFGRRDFIKGTIAALIVSSFPDVTSGAEVDGSDKGHMPVIRIPLVAQDGRTVPITIDLPEHPMEDGHYVKSIEILDPDSRITDKGNVVLSPRIGKAFFSTRLKMADGKHSVKAIIECSVHGRFENTVIMSVVGGQCKEA